MKILMLSHEYPPIGGGGATACRELAARFARDGHRVTVITAGFGALTGGETTPEGAKIIRLPARRRYADHCGFPEMLDYLCRAVRAAVRHEKNGPDDLCLCFFGIPAGPAALYLKKKFGIPYVVRFGGGDIPGFQDRFRLLYRLLSGPLRLIWKEAAALVANSEGLRKTALDFCDRYPVRVIANGVDSAAFLRSDRPEDPEVLRLLSVCRIIERKGLQDVIEALPMLEERTGRRVAYTIVGDGPYREKLENLARERGVCDRVTFTGQKKREEVLPYYRNADVFCCPSRKEGMPNTVLEAMACGLPVIIRADSQGAKELIADNGAAAEGDFGEALASLLLRPAQERARMGLAGRRRAQEEFSWDRTAALYGELFEKITARGEEGHA